MTTTPARLDALREVPAPTLPSPFDATDAFEHRHLGPRAADVAEMLAAVNAPSLDALCDEAVPKSIRLKKRLPLPDPLSESEATAKLAGYAAKNKVFRSLIGQGYHGTLLPGVIRRNVLENPGWYTAYTPYQAEISQGRLEALLNFQTVVTDLTGLPLANASMLDEGTAAAEAMTMARALADKPELTTFFVSSACHPQTIQCVKTRAKSLGVSVVVGDVTELTGGGSAQSMLLNKNFKFEQKPEERKPAKPAAQLENLFGALVQYPTTDGKLDDYAQLADKLHAQGALLVCAADLLALTLLKPPGAFGADLAVGSAQRFGVPMFYGGPHAGFLACKTEFARKLPGRLVGVSKDAHGDPALRLTLQTREQHIRRDRATSNICTAQVLLAVIAGMYAVYHGPEGLKAIATRVHATTRLIADGLREQGHRLVHGDYFDTLRVRPVNTDPAAVLRRAAAAKFNLRTYDDGTLGIAVDETVTLDEAKTILSFFGAAPDIDALAANVDLALPDRFARKTAFLTHAVFNTHRSETAMLRYLRRLEAKDLSLCQSMIPLGSCTMKLNATAEMLPVSWPAFCDLHPFAPADQAKGYALLVKDLEKWLCGITGFAAASLQPNAGSQGEYAGLLAIRAYLEAEGKGARTVCLIPESAHGTNPASAVIAGYKVVPVKCAENGDIDLADLKKQADAHSDDLAALMITYPSTHGVFEEGVKKACAIVHEHGGQVYMDGANMNAQVGLCRPGDIGADVCHLNLHKTFCIPHGGGGPGVGPIAVAKHLAPFLPGTELSDEARPRVSAAPWGSAGILPISWMYCAMMGADGLKRATQTAILNANYMAAKLAGHYQQLYTGRNGRAAHEFILDCRPFEKSANVRVEDIAKRLMDYGFHAPTMSWPVPGTLMVEPTESEDRAELDRFCEAMVHIREEIRAIEEGRSDRADNVLKHAPHTAAAVTADEWPHAYGRAAAAYPLAWVRAEGKFWPSVGRVDNAYGDRNLFCTCASVEEAAEAS